MEAKLEQRLKRILKKSTPKALCLKLVTPGFTGIPDRLILLPGGRVYLREFKDGIKKDPSPRQRVVIQQLTDLGFDVGLIQTNEDIDDFMLLV